jgi:hypothetical protein
MFIRRFGGGIRQARNQQTLLPTALLLDSLAVMGRVEESSQLDLLERSGQDWICLADPVLTEIISLKWTYPRASFPPCTRRRE